MGKLESAMNDLIEVFHQYSKKEGNKYTLTKAELKDLLEAEMASMLEVSVACFLLL